VRQELAAEPRRDCFRNRFAPKQPLLVRQDFGFLAIRHASGAETGEIGGFGHRSSSAFYAMPTEPRSL
jgi:hypothetical protein